MATLVPLVFTSGWASGINPYLVVLLMGLLGRFGGVDQVPSGLTTTPVLVAAGVLFGIDFVTDKVPYLDSAWDAVNTAIRPTAGVVLAVLLSGDATTLQQALLAAFGGATALSSHVVKTGVRVGVNASPEPVTNVVTSVVEDALVASLTVLVFAAPWLAAAIAATLLGIGLTVVVILWRLIRRRLAARAAARAGRREAPDT